MQYVKENAITRQKTLVMTQFVGLLSIATLLPFYLHIQWITGPIINAILIITLFLIGIRSALVVCLVPSLMALSGGLLPPVLAPMVPFIMIANVIFVITIEFIYNNFKKEKRGYWAGIFTGALLKFIFLYASVSFISKLLIKQELASIVVQIMSWPQFATAVLGGILAWVVLKWLKRF